MFKNFSKKKAALYLGLIITAMMCAVDLNLLNGVVFQVVQLVSSVSAVVVKAAAIFVKP